MWLVWGSLSLGITELEPFVVRSVQNVENGDHVYDLVEQCCMWIALCRHCLWLSKSSLLFGKWGRPFLLKFTVHCLKSQQIQLVEKTFVFSPVITNLSHSDADSVINNNSWSSSLFGSFVSNRMWSCLHYLWPCSVILSKGLMILMTIFILCTPNFTVDIQTFSYFI